MKTGGLKKKPKKTGGLAHQLQQHLINLCCRNEARPQPQHLIMAALFRTAKIKPWRAYFTKLLLLVCYMQMRNADAASF